MSIRKRLPKSIGLSLEWLVVMWSTALYFQILVSQRGQWIGTLVHGEAREDFLADPYLNGE